MQEIFSGKAAVRQYLTGLVMDCSGSDFVYGSGFQSEYQDKELRVILQDFHARLSEKVIDDRIIFQKDVESIARRVFTDNQTLQLRYKNVALPMSTIILKDRVVFLGMDPEITLIEIQNIHVAEQYRRFFLQQWNADQAQDLVTEVLRRFCIADNYNGLELELPKEVIAVIKHIERIEDTWGLGGKHGLEQVKLWSVPKTTAEFLCWFVIGIQAKDILEIGTSAGYSSLHLAMAATQTGGRLTTIERLPNKVIMANGNFTRSGLQNITLLSGDAQEVLQKDLGEFDLVFLDADRDSYAMYLDQIMPKLRVGGFIIIDNVFDYGHQMNWLFKRFLGGATSDLGTQTEACVVPADNGIMIIRKVRD